MTTANIPTSKSNLLSRQIFLALVACILLAGPRALAQAEVLQIAKSFPNGGHYNWKGSGTPEAIEFKGKTILPKGTDGTYCSGFTFACAMRVAKQNGLLEEKSFEEIKQFQKEWYGVIGDTNRQAGPAMQNLGIGKSIPVEEAQPGDFIQLWRTKSGHSAVFLGWVEENGKKIGFKYRSSQKSTDGIGDNVEYFSDVPGKRGGVLRNRIYFSRLNLPAPK